MGGRVDLLEIDLHGQTWAEALETFLDAYNRPFQPDGGVARSLDVVHGYGSTGAGGTLRTRLRAFLQRQGARLEFKPGEELDDNQGHTIVTPVKPLPGAEELLEERVLEYCETPRTLSKITGQFRWYGDPKVKQALRVLESQGRLRPVSKGRYKMYQSTEVEKPEG